MDSSQQVLHDHTTPMLQWLNDLADQGVFTTDQNLTIQTWNHWLETHTDLKAKDVIGQNLLEVFPEMKQRHLDRFYQQALDGQVVVLSQRLHGYFIPILTKSRVAPASQMLQSARIAPIVSPGKEVGTITMIEDVTERVLREAELHRQIRTLEQTERALVSSQAKLQHLLASSPAVLYTRACHYQKAFTFVSNNVTIQQGYQAEDFTQDPQFWLAHVHPQDVEEVLDKLDHLEPDYYHVLEYRFLHHNGYFGWMRDEMRLVWTPDGTTQEIVGAWYDVTQQKQVEETLQTYATQLRQTLKFEAALKSITDKVRDSLDEQQILQKAVQELVVALEARGCTAALYNIEARVSNVRHEYLVSASSLQKRKIQFAEFPDLYDSLLQRHSCQVCLSLPNQKDEWATTLTCPIFDDQGVIGDIWLIADLDVTFNDSQVWLVQQVASQCAIALRQARLYESSQSQVQELEKLNQLKDDFLSSVSHELRTPMSNIRMAAQMLEITLGKSDLNQASHQRMTHYLSILRQECEREINLISDLLQLSRLDTQDEPLNLTTLRLQPWLEELVTPYQEQAQSHQQQFHLDLAADLPKLNTDFFYLERILNELLNNACKYTPAAETITLTVHPKADHLDILVINSGVEIPPSEWTRIFDKFYRIPNNDPWKCGGTGLGLALVKKLAERLKGKLSVESRSGQTCFKLELPSLG